MSHRPEDCNGGHGCSGQDCCCPCHFNRFVCSNTLAAALADGLKSPAGKKPTGPAPARDGLDLPTWPEWIAPNIT